MVAHLKGQVLKVVDKGIILDTGNIGYFVFLAKNILPAVKEGKEIELFTHHQITEITSDLYGFATYDELEFFKTLISIKGIGPKVALEILAIDPKQMKSAIKDQDITFISKVPGIGKKTAQRIILELKGEISSSRKHKHIPAETQSDVEDALIKLGYTRNQVRKVLDKAPQKLKEAEEIITYFLKSV